MPKSEDNEVLFHPNERIGVFVRKSRKGFYCSKDIDEFKGKFERKKPMI